MQVDTPRKTMKESFEVLQLDVYSRKTIITSKDYVFRGLTSFTWNLSFEFHSKHVFRPPRKTWSFDHLERLGLSTTSKDLVFRVPSTNPHSMCLTKSFRVTVWLVKLTIQYKHKDIKQRLRFLHYITKTTFVLSLRLRALSFWRSFWWLQG